MIRVRGFLATMLFLLPISIYADLGETWIQLPGLAKDIGVGADGSVWVIGTNPVGTAQDFGIHTWTGSTWQAIDGCGVQISVDDQGLPWVVNSMGQSFRRTPSIK
jgi:hypothetical protein